MIPSNKAKDRDNFPICLTFDKEERIKIFPQTNTKADGLPSTRTNQPDKQQTELRFLDQRTNVLLIERKGVIMVVNMNTFSIDVVQDEVYVESTPMIFQLSLFGAVEQRSSSDTLCLLGKDRNPSKRPTEASKQDPSGEVEYAMRIIDAKDRTKIKTRFFSRKDRATARTIAFGTLSADSQVCFVYFEDKYVVIMKGSNVLTADDVKEHHCSVTTAMTKAYVVSHDQKAGLVSLVFANETGVFLVERARVDAFDKAKEVETLRSGNIQWLLHEEDSSLVHWIEGIGEETSVVCYDLRQRKEVSAIQLSGQVSHPALHNNQVLLLARIQITKNVLTKETGQSNHLFVIDMSNRYTACKEIKGETELFGATALENGFMYLQQTAPRSTSKALFRLTDNSNQDKMNKFLEKSLFDTASRFAEGIGMVELLPRICSIAGEHHYKMKNFETSMFYFKEEITRVQQHLLKGYELDCNSVITRFLDVSKMVFLIEYLCTLHDSSLPVLNEFHQQLLVYCFLKKEMYSEMESWLSRVKSRKSAEDFDKLITLVVSSCL